MRALFLLPLLSACAHMGGVEQGVRARNLAGAWHTARGDHFLIGCSGAFNQDLNDTLTTTHETGAHLTEVTGQGFTVSHWPLASSSYDVAVWPHEDPQGRRVMQAEGMEWVQSRAIDCD